MIDFRNPGIDWAALSPELVLLGGASVVLVVSLFLPLRMRRAFSAFVAAVCFVAAGAAAVALFVADEMPRSGVGATTSG
jgi:hypothetical protein